MCIGPIRAAKLARVNIYIEHTLYQHCAIDRLPPSVSLFPVCKLQRLSIAMTTGRATGCRPVLYCRNFAHTICPSARREAPIWLPEVAVAFFFFYIIFFVLYKKKKSWILIPTSSWQYVYELWIRYYMLYFSPKANIHTCIQACRQQVQKRKNMRKATANPRGRPRWFICWSQLTFTRPRASSLPLATWFDERFVCSIIGQWGKAQSRELIPLLLEYWDKDISPIKWPGWALTQFWMNFACKSLR